MRHAAALHHHTGDRLISAKHRITVNLEDADYQALLHIAAKSDRALAWLGRQAIRDLLQREASCSPADLRQPAKPILGPHAK